jgi:D-lactate dehydrogenase (cytochrome)
MAVSDKQAALRQLQTLVPRQQLVLDRDALITYEVDAGLDRGHPEVVILPKTTDEVAQVAHWAAAHNIPLIARGAGTGLSGGAVPEHGGAILHFVHMSRVLTLDPAGRTAVLQPGAITNEFDARVRQHGLYYPPDPSSGRASTIGGNIAENSGGPHCFKYGVTTNYVIGMEVVTAAGEVLRLGGQALDPPGYDLVGLITGSEGTLAIVTEATVRLIKYPTAVKTLMAAFDSVEQAGRAVSAVIAAGLIPATLEMMDQKIMRIVEDFTPAGLPIDAGAALIVDVDGQAESVGQQINEIAQILQAFGAELRLAQSDAERDKIWYGRKSAAGAMARLAPAFYLVDVTVPRSQLAPALSATNQICDDEGLRVGYVFHAGDGNLHPLILIPDPRDPALLARVVRAGKRIAELCVAYDGSITGEHGVGIEKRAFMPLMYSPAELDAMRDIKAVFDPQGLLNPGKILPPDDDKVTSQPGAQATAHETGVVTPKSDKVSFGQVIAPHNANEAVALLQEAFSAGKRVRVRGGGTKSGLLPTADIVMSTKELRGISAYARDDQYVTVGAGTTLGALQAELARDKFAVPLVGPWPEATIGGIVSANANAPLRMRYGGVRDVVLAATVALCDGRVIRAGRPVVKNVAGYDLVKAFIGAHGTLGLLIDVTLKLLPLPRAQSTLLIGVDDLLQGLAWGQHLLHLSSNASALLLLDKQSAGFKGKSPYALCFTVEGPVEDVRVELSEAIISLRQAGAGTILEGNPHTGNAIWANWLAAAYTRTATTPGLVVQTGLPLGALAGLIDRFVMSNNNAPFVADLANGQLYLHGEIDLTALRAAAYKAGGHAVVLAAAPAQRDGLDVWGRPPNAIELMQRLKERWNPGGLLNPGALLL